MAEVAAKAGVSSQTVSRVANNHDNVDATTRAKVLDAMQALGYRPNAAARALVTGKFGALGVVSFDVGAHGNARTLAAIADAAREAGFSVNFMGIRAQTEAAVQQAFRHLMLQSVDGIVLIESQMLDTPSLRLPPTMPIVVADGDTGHRYPHVDFDQARGTRSVVAHLLEMGHRTVHHVSGPRDSFAARRRAETWERTVVAVGAPCTPPCTGTGAPSPATWPAGRWRRSPMSRPCSRPTTRWRWGCCAPCTRPDARCRKRSAWPASTTSPRPGSSSRR